MAKKNRDLLLLQVIGDSPTESHEEIIIKGTGANDALADGDVLVVIDADNASNEARVKGQKLSSSNLADSVTAGTKTKVTYNAKGLVTAGTDAGIADITGLQAALDDKIPLTQKGVANGVASLDATGLIFESQIPKIPIVNVQSVLNETARLALTSPTNVQVGDIVVQTSDSKVFMLKATPPSNSANWIELATPGNIDTALLKANNLNDLTNVVNARTNLGLGDAATKNLGTTAGTVSEGNHHHDASYVAKNGAITGATKTKITYDAKGLVTAGADAEIADIAGLQAALDNKVVKNANITGAAKTKITYDAKGLVIAGADAGIADIAGLQAALDGKSPMAHTHPKTDIVGLVDDLTALNSGKLSVSQIESIILGRDYTALSNIYVGKFNPLTNKVYTKTGATEQGYAHDSALPNASSVTAGAILRVCEDNSSYSGNGVVGLYKGEWLLSTGFNYIKINDRATPRNLAFWFNTVPASSSVSQASYLFAKIGDYYLPAIGNYVYYVTAISEITNANTAGTITWRRNALSTF